jgi:hypothetical protein|tara:strand:+ start:518 stop:979 length:462 start_codon:yes stop_codon:yes gene_type:complete
MQVVVLVVLGFSSSATNTKLSLIGLNMAHYAKIKDNIVVEVIVAEKDFVDTLDGTWVQTSYNTRGNLHYGPDGTPDGGVALRGNYALIGYVYDNTLDAFIAPQPYPAFNLDPDTLVWQPPHLPPQDERMYSWDEDSLSWIAFIPENITWPTKP